jgi:hypothetical protein
MLAIRLIVGAVHPRRDRPHHHEFRRKGLGYRPPIAGTPRDDQFFYGFVASTQNPLPVSTNCAFVKPAAMSVSSNP